ncbi:MAG: STAS domain-containing protein [Actinobacteria bacterium]|nr:STAS domain-containing protein [Actinomycetota bacterium]
MTATDDGDRREVPVDASALGSADLASVELLARLALTARRCGARLRVRDAPPELLALLEQAGLTQALGVLPRDGREAVGQAEHREPPGGVEERVHLDDPPV